MTRFPSELSQGEESERRSHAAGAVSPRRASMAIEQISDLIARLSHPDHYVRYLAAYGLSEYGFLATDAVPMLITLLDDYDEWVASWSARALGEIECAAEVAIPALVRHLKDRNERVRISCGEALARLGNSAV